MATHERQTGQLTHEGMVQSVKEGKSFIYKGKIISQLNDPDFPSPAQLAADTGDSSELERVRRDNEAMIERLRRENAVLTSQAKAAEQKAAQAAPAQPQAPQAAAPAKK